MVGSFEEIDFKILVGNVDKTLYFRSANLAGARNTIPTANVVMSNNDFNLNTHSAGDTIVISASKDGIFSELFSGSVIKNDKGSTQEEDEVCTLICSGAPEFSHLAVSPCNVTIGPCEIGEAFKGKTPDRNSDSFTVDSKGNYPNGLLYHTDYTLSADSVVDVFADTVDIANPLAFSLKYLTSAMGSICKAYGIDYFIDPINKRVKLRSASALGDYPTKSDFTLSYGYQLMNLNMSEDDSETADFTLVLGSDPSVFAFVGDKTSADNLAVTYDNVNTLNVCLDNAKMADLIYNQPNEKISLNVPALTTDILGERISIYHPYHSTSFGNVVGVSHDIAPDRWVTTIELEGIERNLPRTITEIKEELKSDEAMNEKGRVYLFCENKKNSSTFYNIVAMGVGSSTLTGNSYPFSKILPGGIKPIVDLIEEPDGKVSVWGQFGANEVNDRIYEVTLYANSKGTYGPRELAKTVVDWTRSAQPVIKIGDYWYFKIHTTSTTYPLGINYCKGTHQESPDQSNAFMQYWKTAKQCARALYITGSAYGAGATLPVPDHSVWETAKGITRSKELDAMSVYAMGAEMKPYVLRDSLGLSTQSIGIIVLMEWDTGLTNEMAKAVNSTSSLEFYSKINDYYDATNHGSNLEMAIFDYNTNAWSVSGHYTTSAEAWQARHIGFTKDHVSSDGLISVALHSYSPDTIEQMYLHRLYMDRVSIQYRATTQLARAVSEIGVFEEAKLLYTKDQEGRVGATFQSSKRIHRIKGVYLSASYDDEHGVWEKMNSKDAVNLLDVSGEYPGVFGNKFYIPAAGYVDQYIALHMYKPVWQNYLDPITHEPIRDIISRNERVFIEYDYRLTEQLSLPASTAVPNSSFVMTLSSAYPDGMVAHIHQRNDEFMPPVSSSMELQYTAIGGEMISRCKVTASRIDQGFDKDTTKELFIQFRVETTSETSNAGSIYGFGVTDP